MLPGLCVCAIEIYLFPYRNVHSAKPVDYCSYANANVALTIEDCIYTYKRYYSISCSSYKCFGFDFSIPCIVCSFRSALYCFAPVTLSCDTVLELLSMQ